MRCKLENYIFYKSTMIISNATLKIGFSKEIVVLPFLSALSKCGQDKHKNDIELYGKLLRHVCGHLLSTCLNSAMMYAHTIRAITRWKLLIKYVRRVLHPCVCFRQKNDTDVIKTCVNKFLELEVAEIFLG